MTKTNFSVPTQRLCTLPYVEKIIKDTPGYLKAVCAYYEIIIMCLCSQHHTSVCME